MPNEQVLGLEYRQAYLRSVNLKDKGRDVVVDEIKALFKKVESAHYPTLHIQLNTPRFVTMAAIWALVDSGHLKIGTSDYLERNY